MKPMWPRWFLTLTNLFSKIYHRGEVSGLDGIPAGPCLIVGNHNGGAGCNPEIWVFGSAYLSHPTSQHPTVALAHSGAFKIPGLSRYMKWLGAVPAEFKTAQQQLQSGKRVLVYPGGAWESCRPFRDRHKVDFKDRSGFVRLARECGVPIVPVVAIGAHSGWYVWKRGDEIAKFFGFDKRFHVDAFPIGIAIPFGPVIGTLIPFLQLPVKVKVRVLDPIRVDERTDAEIARQVVAKMQEAMDREVV